MPRTNNAPPPPPKVMTWPKAAPVLIVAGVFWALRLLFEMFWFFGPALATLYCSVKLGGGLQTWIGSSLGAKAAAAACTAAGGVIGFFGAPAIAAFGVVMAMAVGFIGWLVIGGWLIVTNRRIFEDNALWFVGGFALSEIPFVGALPSLLGALFKMYGNQIKKDKARLAAWKQEQEQFAENERATQEAELMQAQAMASA